MSPIDNLLILAGNFLNCPDQAEKGMECIERALKIDPKSREALIYKGKFIKVNRDLKKNLLFNKNTLSNRLE